MKSVDFGLLLLAVISLGCSKISFEKKSSSSTEAAATTDSGSSATGDASGSAAASVINIAPEGIGQGVCTDLAPITQDANGNQIDVDADHSLTFTTSTSTGNFYADSSCTTKFNAMTIAANSSQADIYYKDSAVGNATITVTDESSPSLGTFNYDVAVLAPLQLAFNGLTFSQSTAACGEFSVQLRDSSAKPVVYDFFVDVYIKLDTTSATGHFYSDPGCRQPTFYAEFVGGTTDSLPVYYLDPTAGSATWTGTMQGATTWLPATIQEKITP